MIKPWMREPGSAEFEVPAFQRQMGVLELKVVKPVLADAGGASDFPAPAKPVDVDGKQPEDPARMGHDLDKDDLNPNA